MQYRLKVNYNALLTDVFKFQCVGFRGIFWQIRNIIFILVFSLVCNRPKLRIDLFSLP